jgi:hypothetical protein
VPERMNNSRLLNPSPTNRLGNSSHGRRRKRFLARRVTKQPVLRPVLLPVLPENLQIPLAQERIPIFVPFPMSHANHHPLTVDIRQLQLKRFTDPQTRRVDRHQNRPMLKILDRSEENLHLLLRQTNRKPPPSLPLGNPELLPIPLERRLIKKLQCPIGLRDRSLRNVSLLDKIMEILSNLRVPQFRKRS